MIFCLDNKSCIRRNFYNDRKQFFAAICKKCGHDIFFDVNAEEDIFEKIFDADFMDQEGFVQEEEKINYCANDYREKYGCNNVSFCKKSGQFINNTAQYGSYCIAAYKYSKI